MAKLTESQKNDIKKMKKRVGRLLLHANKIQNLNSLEKELLGDILDRQTIDRYGDYDGRIKMAYQDLYLCAGIIYWHIDYNTMREICEPKPVTFQ